MRCALARLLPIGSAALRLMIHEQAFKPAQNAQEIKKAFWQDLYATTVSSASDGPQISDERRLWR